MVKKFSELLFSSWAEYKGNFKLIFKIFFILYILPYLAVFLFSTYGLAEVNEKLSAIAATEGISATAAMGGIKEILLSALPSLTIYLVLILISAILGFIMSVTLVNFSFSLRGKQSKITTTSQAIKSASRYLGRYILLVIVVSLALSGLFLLFIIPAIIFYIYWIFGAYVLIGENKRIIESLRRSRLIVRGRWWRVLGYGLLLMLVFIAIIIIFLIPGSILGTLFQSTAISNIFSLGAYLIIFPLGILFLKNFYLDLKANLRKK